MPKIQFRRGNKNGLPALSHGEPALTLDTSELFIGGQNGNLQIPVLDQDGKVPEGQLPPDGSAAVQEALDEHVGDKNNPHEVTAAQVGASLVVKGTYPIASGYTISAGDVVDVNESGQLGKSVATVANTENILVNSAVRGTAFIKLNSQYSVVACAMVSNGRCVLIDNATGEIVSIQNFTSSTISTVSLVRLNDTQFVVSWIVDSNRLSQVVVGTVSGTSITFGNTVNPLSNVTSMVMVALDDTHVAFITYFSSGLGVMRFTINGTSIYSGTNASTPAQPLGLSAVLLPDDSAGNKRIFIGFKNNTTNRGTAVIATIDNSGVATYGDTTIFDNDNNLDGSGAILACCESNGDVIVLYSFSNGLRTAVLSISESSITPNSYVQLKSQTTNNVCLITDGSKVIALYNDGNGKARFLERSGTSISALDEFTFNIATSRYISADFVESNKFIVAYGDDENSTYGRTTILETMGTEIAGKFVETASQAIALQGGTAGDNIEVIFDGIIAADWITAGQIISSDGVYGVGVLSGVLQVWSKDRPGKVQSGSYIGTGLFGENNPNKIVTDSPPNVVFISAVNTPNNSKDLNIFIRDMVFGVSIRGGGGAGSEGGADTGFYGIVSFSGNGISWYSNNNAVSQMNTSGTTYNYVILS